MRRDTQKLFNELLATGVNFKQTIYSDDFLLSTSLTPVSNRFSVVCVTGSKVLSIHRSWIADMSYPHMLTPSTSLIECVWSLVLGKILFKHTALIITRGMETKLGIIFFVLNGNFLYVICLIMPIKSFLLRLSVQYPYMQAHSRHQSKLWDT